MRLRLFYCKKKSYFFTKKARARTFAQIRLKPKNACNIHNLKLACKETASYNFKVGAKMTHNETPGYWRAGQSALIFILTQEMNSSCPNTCKLTSNM